MKFIVSSTDLLKKLQVIAGVLNSSNTLPILDNFLFEIEAKKLTCSASDLETTMVTSLPVESKENGSIAVPARLLLDTLKTFPELPLTFSVEKGDVKTIEISSDNGKYKLAGYDGNEFPKSPAMESANSTSIDASILDRLITKTIFATGNDELRPVMSGVYFVLNNDDLTLAATDAHKLVQFKRLDAGSSKGASFIVPKKPLNLVKNVLSNSDCQVTIEYNDSNVYFKIDDVSLICRLIDGKYPNYEAVIPSDNPYKLVVDRKSFLSSIKRISIFSNKTTHQVRLSISGNELNISAEDLDFSNEANERLTCVYNGEDMKIAFNSQFLVEMLNNLDSEDARLELSTPGRAGLLFPSVQEDNESILMLVMPVMLNDN